MMITNQNKLMIALTAVLALYLSVANIQQGTAQQDPTSAAQAAPSPSSTPENAQITAAPRQNQSTRLLCNFFGLRQPAPGDYCPLAENPQAGYKVEHLIVTIPDPRDSRLDYLFDRHLDAIQRAIEASGYKLDRHFLPWDRVRSSQTQAAVTTSSRRDYTREPGIILFRTAEQKLLLLFLVGETPTSGIHKAAFSNALDQILALPEWLGERTKPKIRILGPTFSGSIVSLEIALNQGIETVFTRTQQRPDVQIVTGTATAINQDEFIKQIGQIGQIGNSASVTFNSTVPPDGEAERAFTNYLIESGGISTGTGEDPRSEIAYLIESNTGYGQEVRDELLRSGSQTVNSRAPLILPFPLHISKLRNEAAKTKSSISNSLQELMTPSDVAPLYTVEGGETRARDIIPQFSQLETATIEQVLEQIFSAIHRDPIRYIGLFTTDVQDRIFLVHELRKRCPNTVIFLFSADLLYLHSDANLDFQGSLVISPYPLFSLNQHWSFPFAGHSRRLQFPSQTSQGCYNATLKLLGHENRMIEYGAPFDIGYSNNQSRKPPLWLSIVGRDAIWPVRILRYEEKDRDLMAGSNGKTDPLDPIASLSPEASPSGVESEKGGADVGTVFVGLRDHSSFSHTSLLLISLFCLFPSLVLLAQLARSKLSNNSGNRLFKLIARKLDSLRVINRGWVGRTFSVDDIFRYGFDRRVYLFSCCVSLLIISLGCVIVSLLPDWIGFNRAIAQEHVHWFNYLAYAVLALTLIVLLTVNFWLLLSIVHWVRQPYVGNRSRTLAFFSLVISLGMFVAACFALGDLVRRTFRDEYSAAEALFFYLRATDFRSGVSLMVPWILVGFASFLAFFGAVRRLDLAERMYSLNDQRGESPAFPPFLNFSAPSFKGLNILEMKVKDFVIGRIFSVPGAFLMIFIILIPYSHRFIVHHIPSIEGRWFDWFFIISFYLVPLLLVWAFLRFCWLSFALGRFLGRLGLHPLFNTPLNTQDASFKMLPKVNLMSPSPSYSGMSASITQAKEFFRLLNKAAENDGVSVWPDTIKQNIYLEIEVAEEKLEEAIEAESEGRWKDALEPRRKTQEAISEASKEITKWMEPHWTSLVDDTGKYSALIRQGRMFMISHVATFLQYILVHLQNLAGVVTLGLILVLAAAISYPFHPRDPLLLFSWVTILIVAAATIFTFVQLNRDRVISLLSGTEPGVLNLSRDLLYRVLIHGVIPILALLGAQFPQALNHLMSWLKIFEGKG